MKKLILIFTILLPYLTHTSDNPKTPQEVIIWRENFKEINNPSWDKYAAMQTRQNKLGYNPDITLIEKNHPDVVQQGGPTLAIHGWNSSKDAYSFAKHCKSENVPGDVIMFNFQDASYWYKQTIPYWFPISKSSFAGRPDILALLHVLKTTHDLQCNPAVLYPHSRGAGTTMAVIGMLNKPETIEQKLLDEWEVTETDRTNILQVIKVIYLLNPLTNIDNAINVQLERRLFLLYLFLPQCAQNKILSFVKNTVLPSLTRYDLQQKNPIDYIKQWEDIKSRVWLHFDENDWDVSNKDDIELTLQLRKHFQPGQLYVSCTNDGGHKAYQRLINDIIHYFNGTLKPECSCDDQIKWNSILKANDAQLYKNDKENIDVHLKYYSKEHSYRSFRNHRMTQRIITAIQLLVVIVGLYYLNNSQSGILGYHFALDSQYLTIYR